ncbi:acyltransferase [Halococcus sediminicola]|uniref:acyltransferase n=1 Tax=Halococcus sediminicola TaxID=1264579 RepID=UPI0009AC27BA|nr:acyltransferase [Halococcus sediminicola]
MGERIYSIDSLRAIAVFFVVVAHVQPFAGVGSYGNHIYFILDTIGQFDVPFFFVTSGYFLKDKLDSDRIKSTIQGSFQKLGSLYLFGIGLYISSVALTTGIALLAGRQPRTSLSSLFESLSPVGLIYYGDAVAPPLWFLTALFFSICFVSLFVALDKTRCLLSAAAAAHVVGLIGQNYPMIAEFSVPTRDALFFGFFYVALGFWIRSVRWSPSTNRRRTYLGIVIAAAIGQIAEQYVVNYLLRGLTISQGTYTTEYTLSTVVLVFALFAYALSNPNWGKRTVAPQLGTLAVGVYLVHFPVYQILKALNRLVMVTGGIDPMTTVVWQILAAPVVYILSLVMYVLLAKMGLIEIGGSHVPRLDRVRTRLGSQEGA